MKAAVLEIAGAGALEERLARTLRDLAAFGENRAGMPGGAASAAYIRARLGAAGIETGIETFRFPAFVLHGSSLRAGARPVVHDVLAYSGCGAVEGPLAHVGTGEPADYDGRDVAGRIVLVERNVTYHRSAHDREAVGRGAPGL